MYSMAGHQPATIQTLALGATRHGKLTGIRHDSISPTPIFDNYIEYAALCPRSLWAASEGIWTNHKIVHVNRNTPTAGDRKSTRLNSSHGYISYAVFCLKKKKTRHYGYIADPRSL